MVGLVAVVVLIFVLTRPGATPAPVPTPNGKTAAQLLSQLTSLPQSTLDQVGAGTANSSGIQPMTGQAPLESGGKPEILYMGAEYCPYCAAERWSLIVALSRFGTLTGAGLTASSSTDAYPNTPTWTFHGSSYVSQYLAFEAVEQADRQGRPLEQPTAAQATLINKYTNGTIPFIAFGNKLFLSGATYLPQDLQGMTWQQIIDALQDPSTPQAKDILGSANYLTAAICRATGDQPAAVCSNPVVQRLEAALPRS